MNNVVKIKNHKNKVVCVVTLKTESKTVGKMCNKTVVESYKSHESVHNVVLKVIDCIENRFNSCIDANETIYIALSNHDGDIIHLTYTGCNFDEVAYDNLAEVLELNLAKLKECNNSIDRKQENVFIYC